MAINKSLLAVTACAIVSSCVGCMQMPAQPIHLKSPIEFIHGVAFGPMGSSQSEYIGSEHARDWAMAEHAESMARQQQQFAASMAAKQQSGLSTQHVSQTTSTMAPAPTKANPTLR